MLSTTFLESGVIREIDRLLSGRVTWELVVSAGSFHPAGCQNGERIDGLYLRKVLSRRCLKACAV
jgi:hypothetical protein